MANSVNPDEMACFKPSGSTLFAQVSVLVCWAEKGYDHRPSLTYTSSWCGQGICDAVGEKIVYSNNKRPMQT